MGRLIADDGMRDWLGKASGRDGSIMFYEQYGTECRIVYKFKT